MPFIVTVLSCWQPLLYVVALSLIRMPLGVISPRAAAMRSPRIVDVQFALFAPLHCCCCVVGAAVALSLIKMPAFVVVAPIPKTAIKPIVATVFFKFVIVFLLKFLFFIFQKHFASSALDYYKRRATTDFEFFISLNYCNLKG
jgi:hypothetical protein